MPGVDWIPGVSQLKSAVQLVLGDTEGAKTTLENFSRECPGVSQITSLVQLTAGDAEGALETQKQCLGTLNNVANGIPVVGHVKGVVHHVVGDHSGGNQAFNAATRTTAVITSGAAAGIATGGLGAIPAGIAAGVGYDVAASAISDTNQGYVAALKHAADNPSAGAIFDAIAIPVGDGLTGYSGGQIANKIKVNSLETVRAAKMDKLDSAMFDQKVTGGEALKLGKEINALTSEINTIKHGSPRYWTDVKSGEVISEASSSSVVGAPIPGYIDEKNQGQDENNQDQIPTRIYQDDSLAQEDALHYDSYVEAIVTKDNRREKQKQLQRLDNQSAQNHIYEAYKNVKLTTFETLHFLLQRLNKDQNGDPNRDPNRNPNDLKKDVCQLIRWSWLSLTMPKEFPYTAVTQLNSMVQGLYHSYTRHMDDWGEVISFDDALTDRLSPLMTEINCLGSARNATDAENARKKFLEARKRLSQATYNDVQVALVEIQLLLHRFIQENITFENFEGRNINENGHEQLYFKVKTKTGEKKVMVLSLSDQRFLPATEDSRPIRILVTVFFKSWDEFQSFRTLETKAEMQKKGKK